MSFQDLANMKVKVKYDPMDVSWSWVSRRMLGPSEKNGKDRH